jgi:dipeptidyl aminopeptidase/acylaminoacyl peptidase
MFPETYACGVDLVGPSNLITLLESMPPYWKPMLEMFTTRVGDHRTEDGRALLKKHSPLTYVDRICRPLLIGQGANDPRVKQAESDQIVKAMQAKTIPVTYVLYPDEGHGFARPQNTLSFNAIAEAFLAKVLGGRHEPVGEDFQGSSLQVLAGAADVPGLPEALQNQG